MSRAALPVAEYVPASSSTTVQAELLPCRTLQGQYLEACRSPPPVCCSVNMSVHVIRVPPCYCQCFMYSLRCAALCCAATGLPSEFLRNASTNVRAVECVENAICLQMIAHRLYDESCKLSALDVPRVGTARFLGLFFLYTAVTVVFFGSCHAQNGGERR